MTRNLVQLIAAVAIFFGSAPARAYISDDDACGYAPAGWNAPNGASVATRAPNGPIAKLMDAIGEHFSHQMLSHGPGSDKWVSQATMKTPGIEVGIFGDDQVDYEDLLWGYPGPSQVNMGAVYHSLYRDSGSTEIKYTSGDAVGAQVADYLWYTLPYCGNVSSGPCYQGVYSQEDDGEVIYIIGRREGSTTYRHSYAFFQYQDDRSVPNGDDTSALGWGLHCSTFMAWALNIVTGQTISSKTYSNAIIRPAAYTLHDALEDECDDQAGWFGGLFVDCDDISDQIVNCFTAEVNGPEVCDNDQRSVWQSFAATGTATSVSPDRVLGRAGNGGGPWAGKAQQQVYWNQGGNVYGCFF